MPGHQPEHGVEVGRVEAGGTRSRRSARPIQLPTGSATPGTRGGPVSRSRRRVGPRPAAGPPGSGRLVGLGLVAEDLGEAAAGPIEVAAELPEHGVEGLAGRSGTLRNSRVSSFRPHPSLSRPARRRNDSSLRHSISLASMSLCRLLPVRVRPGAYLSAICYWRAPRPPTAGSATVRAPAEKASSHP